METKRVNFKGINFDVDYIYTPSEKNDGFIDPDYPASVEVVKIEHKKDDFSEFFTELDIMCDIEEIILKSY